MTELPDDFSISINNDFGLMAQASDDIDKLVKMRLAGELSRETFLEEVKRRGLLIDTLKIEEEMARIETEGPSLEELDDETVVIPDDEATQ